MPTGGYAKNLSMQKVSRMSKCGSGHVSLFPKICNYIVKCMRPKHFALFRYRRCMKGITPCQGEFNIGCLHNFYNDFWYITSFTCKGKQCYLQTGAHDLVCYNEQVFDKIYNYRFLILPLIEDYTGLMETLLIKLHQPHDIFIAGNKSINGSGWDFQLHEIPFVIQGMELFRELTSDKMYSLCYVRVL